MQQARRRRAVATSKRPSVLLHVARRLCDSNDTQAFLVVAALLLMLEAGLCAWIIARVPYTEIDYTTYLQQVDGYEQGERDYRKLGGDTGPLVYPAGHLYIYSALRRFTGGSIPVAQLVFAGLYLATQAVVMLVYARTRSVPPWSLALLCVSRRLHSIYVLRLFNDCWAMLLAYAGTATLQRRRWVLSVLLFSAAVSIKMNVLLMAPGVLAVMIQATTPVAVAAAVAAGSALQLAAGAPFLLHSPGSYLAKAFEFSRVFMYKWTVNWHFLPEPWFTSGRFGALLLATHLRLLWSLATRQWFAGQSLTDALRAFFARWSSGVDAGEGEKGAGVRRGDNASVVFSPDAAAYAVFSANFVGILCSRTLHYQFYCWYFHTLPYLLLRSGVPAWQALALLAGIEVVWNMYPPRPETSLALLVLHTLLVAAVLFPRGAGAETARRSRRTQRLI